MSCGDPYAAGKSRRRFGTADRRSLVKAGPGWARPATRGSGCAHRRGRPRVSRAKEIGIRPARALPYELNVNATVNASNSTINLTFLNTGRATVVFQVRSTK